jgi:hypothetical protein
MKVLPLNSQVLLRREGYREALTLWQAFQKARRPLFSQLQHAIDARDIATLYEIWAYFALINDIAAVLRRQPVLDIETSTSSGLAWGATANFGGGCKLLYNRGFGRPRSYSVRLRPDYTWIRDGSLDVVFDAKFALQRLTDNEDDIDSETTAKRRDLYKMHTYRDALGVRAAVAVYPGTRRVFYPSSGQRDCPPTLAGIITGNAEGIGALPYAPHQT